MIENKLMHSTHEGARTGSPPIRETAASIKSVSTSIEPSGTPNNTEVSTSDNSSWSESDHSSCGIGILLGIEEAKRE